jgi:peptidoglycan hydrolase-like protein with peptidoglycan-binding domain
MKRAFLFLVTLSLAVLARADDQTQAVQQALKDQGFYYGQVDGQSGPETDAAVRRYQIRQGLDVTGKLDEQTLDSLHLGNGSSDGNTLHAVTPPSDTDDTAQSTPAPKNVVQSDQDFLRTHPKATPAPQDDDSAPPPARSQAPAMTVVPDDSTDDQSVPPAQPAQPAQPVQPAEPAEPVAPPGYQGQPYPGAPYAGPAGNTLASDYVHFFRKTPYETAPPTVQRSTVARAQMRLGRQGFYRGPVDGQLSDSLARAIAGYQRDADISSSGRLDMRTLSDMGLLPTTRRVIVGPQPFYGGGGPVPGPVYRGIWVH